MEELRYHNKTPHVMRASVLWLGDGWFYTRTTLCFTATVPAARKIESTAAVSYSVQRIMGAVLLNSSQFWAPTVPRCSLDGEWFTQVQEAY